MSNEPTIRRVRHELQRRRVVVDHIEQLAPKLVRIAVRGETLRGFTSLGFDDHVKVFFPVGAVAAAATAFADEPSVARDFTPRRFDAETHTLWVDFFLHGKGPAALWAAQAKPGDAIVIGGPRGSSIIELEGIQSHVLIGDETALPAIERRLEELPPHTQALVIVEIEAGNEQRLTSRASLEVVWVTRGPQRTSPAEQLIEALRACQFPAGTCFFWAATETQGARALRRYLTEERGINKAWIKAAGYWQRGAEGTHMVVDD